MTPASVAFCWGANGSGQLGNNSTTSSRLPVRVSGGLAFRSVFAAGVHTCGATTDFVGKCWGRNEDGQLGDGTTILKKTPTTVLGGHDFRQVTAGAAKGGSWNSVSCGLDRNNAAFCWGDNLSGALGDGTTTSRSRPVAVRGGLQFAFLATGGVHTCAVTTGHVAYCWGSNGNWQLGDGSRNDHHAPTAVSGGLAFRDITTGTFHTCAITVEDAYCWGSDQYGQIGDGTVDGTPFVPHATPTAVIGPS